MHYTTIVLAFLGGGIAEALVAFAAHHLHPRKPQPITLDAETRELLEKHIAAHQMMSPGAQRAVADKYARPDIKMASDVVDILARRDDWNRPSDWQIEHGDGRAPRTKEQQAEYDERLRSAAPDWVREKGWA